MAIPQKTHTPANKPYTNPIIISISGVFKNIARLAAIISERINVQPKIFTLLLLSTSATVRLLSVIQALPKTTGEYHKPPNIKEEIAAASTTSQLTVFR